MSAEPSEVLDSDASLQIAAQATPLEARTALAGVLLEALPGQDRDVLAIGAAVEAVA